MPNTTRARNAINDLRRRVANDIHTALTGPRAPEDLDLLSWERQRESLDLASELLNRVGPYSPGVGVGYGLHLRDQVARELCAELETTSTSGPPDGLTWKPKFDDWQSRLDRIDRANQLLELVTPDED